MQLYKCSVLSLYFSVNERTADVSENLNVSFCKLLAFMYDIVSQSRPSIHLTIVHQSGGK